MLGKISEFRVEFSSNAVSWMVLGCPSIRTKRRTQRQILAIDVGVRAAAH